jgi:hypothetical protein
MAAASEIVIASKRRSLARPKSVRSWARNKLCFLDLRHVSPPFKAGAQACLSATGSSLRGKADDRRCIGSRTRNSQLFRPITKRQRSNAISTHSDQVFSRFAGAVVREAIARLRPSGSGAAARRAVAREASEGWWRTQSISNLSQHPNSLLTGEINREFCKIQHSTTNLRAWTRVNPTACSEIPYATEQGILVKEQGICLQEQGI